MKLKRILLTFLVFFTVCVGASAKSFKKINTYKIASGDIQEYKLDNGIRVYYKYSDASELDAVCIGLKGGFVQYSSEYSGLQETLFDMMSKGSSLYTRDDISALEYQTQSSISKMSHSTGSVLYLSCLDYYLDTMLPVLLDGFTHPVFDENQYNILMQENEQRITRETNNQETVFYKDFLESLASSEYQKVGSSITQKSLPNITLNNLKDWHSKVMDSQRIFVIVYGKCEIAGVLDKLNGGLGKIKKQKTKLIQPEITPLKLNNEPFIRKTAEATGNAVLVRAFSAPSPFSDDYAATLITPKIYSTIMYNVLRVKYGACYTPSSSVEGYYMPVGIDVIYKASNLTDFNTYLDECNNIMASGNVITSVNPDGSFQLASISDVLNGYKNSYITANFSSQQTSLGNALNLAMSKLEYDNFNNSELLIERIQKLSQQDIVNVFKTYWLSDQSTWGAYIGPDDTIQF